MQPCGTWRSWVGHFKRIAIWHKSVALLQKSTPSALQQMLKKVEGDGNIFLLFKYTALLRPSLAKTEVVRAIV